MKRQWLPDLALLAFSAIGVFALWRETQDLPFYKIWIGQLLAFIAFSTYLSLWAGRAFSFGMGMFARRIVRAAAGPGAAQVERMLPRALAPRVDLASVFFGLAFGALAVVTTGLVGAINVLFGIMALVALGVSMTMGDLAAWFRGRLLGFAYILAGGVLLFMGGLFLLAYRDLQTITGEDTGLGLGAMVAFLGPGIRSVMQGIARQRGPLVEIPLGPGWGDPSDTGEHEGGGQSIVIDLPGRRDET